MSDQSASTTTTIFVGNIQSIRDEQLREYFERYGPIEAFYHNGTQPADDWLIDYRFIRFSADTDINVLLTTKIDHTICRIRLDIHPCTAAFRDETRLILDRKIGVAHTNAKLDRNVVKKAFTKYGRILNCTCVSSGNGLEYVYIEYESINSLRSVLAAGQRHSAGRTPLIVKQLLRPSMMGVKAESVSIRANPPSRSEMDTAQYTSALQSDPESRLRSPVSMLTDRHGQSSKSYSEQQLKLYAKEYELPVQDDLHEITYQIDKFLRNQQKSYRKLYKYILAELHSASSCEDGELESDASPASNSSKRLKSHHD